jgi:excisionase family DNA binding protein
MTVVGSDSPHFSANVGKTAVPSVDAAGIRLFSADELAETLGQTKRWVYRQVEERGLPAIRLGRSIVFQLPAVMAWLEAQRIGDWTGQAGDGW